MASQQGRHVRRRCPAKVNLCLHIRGRRPDGYHLLESLVASISLFDEISLRYVPGDEERILVASDSADAPGGPTNLAHRAAAALFAATGERGTVEIDLRKRIPVGSGLGGGSSNAATVLLTLNELLSAPLRREELVALGSRLGADVSLFMVGTPAIIEGVGEKVTQIDLPRPLSLVICSDRGVLPTREVFARLDLSLTSGNRASNIRRFVAGDASLAELLVNDLEAPAGILHPPILTIRRRLLEAGVQGALMTGSGSAVFGVCSDDESARRISAVMRQSGYWAESVKTLNHGQSID